MKKVLITGASGFVGGYLVSEALSRNFNVYAGIRKSSSKEYLSDPRIHFLYIDYEDKVALKNQLSRENFDYIIHNAGITKAHDLSGYVKVNATYVQNLVECMQETNTIPQKFIYVSSLAAVGPGDDNPDLFIRDNSPVRPVTHYGKSKLIAEQFLESQDDFPYIILRPTAVYGPREKDLLTVFKMINKGLDIRVSVKNQKLSFIFVEDLARLMLDAAVSNHKQKSYVVSDNQVYSSDLLNNSIKEALSKKAITLNIPVSVLSIIASISGFVSRLTGKVSILNKNKVNEIKCQSWAVDAAGIKEDFNFAPSYLLREGIKRTADWYNKNNWL